MDHGDRVGNPDLRVTALFRLQSKIDVDRQMDQIQSGDQIIRYDREQTKRAYSAINGGDAERCGCSSCMNFAAQRQSAYPDAFRLLLDQLGIDAEKEGEAYECGQDGAQTIYGGWFYFAGKIIQPGERTSKDTASGFQHWFVDAKNLPRPAADFGKSVIAVEFLQDYRG